MPSNTIRCLARVAQPAKATIQVLSKGQVKIVINQGTNLSKRQQKRER
jgi:hypothetical protein